MEPLAPSKQGKTRYLTRDVAVRYGVLLMAADRAAQREFRERLREHRDTSGIVLVWLGEVVGWCNQLRDPQHNKPGMFAVDSDGNAWIAAGGNDQAGAREWVQLQTVTPPAQVTA